MLIAFNLLLNLDLELVLDILCSGMNSSLAVINIQNIIVRI